MNDLGKKMITKIPQYIYIYMAKSIEFFQICTKAQIHDMNDLGHWVLGFCFLGTGKGCKAQILKAFEHDKCF
jgi:hypothetical protein